MKLCVVCQYENLEGALVCHKCGALFTVKIPVSMAATVAFTNPIVVQAEEDHSLFVYILGEKQPLVFRNQKEITLGRTTADTPAPSLDLSVYANNTLGVSRRHAVIEYNGNGYTIRDVGSSNGTFLNDNLLIPHRNYHLQPGDRLRLGQLPMMVTFKAKKNTETAFYLTYNEAKPRFYPSDLSREVMPYLQALENVQAIVNDALENQEGGISLRSLKFEPAANRVAVHTQGGTEAIRYVQEVVTPYKKINETALKANLPELNVDNLAQTVTARIQPNFPPEKAKAYSDKLLPVLPVFLFSPLDLSLMQ